jgi:hypothetical protein
MKSEVNPKTSKITREYESWEEEERDLVRETYTLHQFERASLLSAGVSSYPFKVKPLCQLVPSTFHWETDSLKLDVSYKLIGRLVGRQRGQYVTLLITEVPLQVTQVSKLK